MLSSLGIVEMPFDVNEILGILENSGVDTSEISATSMYEILLTVDWDTYVITKTSILDLLSDLGVDLNTITEDMI